MSSPTGIGPPVRSAGRARTLVAASSRRASTPPTRSAAGLNAAPPSMVRRRAGASRRMRRSIRSTGMSVSSRSKSAVPRKPVAPVIRMRLPARPSRINPGRRRLVEAGHEGLQCLHLGRQGAPAGLRDRDPRSWTPALITLLHLDETPAGEDLDVASEVAVGELEGGFEIGEVGGPRLLQDGQDAETGTLVD